MTCHSTATMSRMLSRARIALGELHAGALGPGLTAPAARSATPSELGVVAGQLAVVLREEPKGQGPKGAKQHPRNAAPEDLRLDNMLAAKWVP